MTAFHRVPAVYHNRNFPRAGGLLAYVADYPDLWRRAASYVDRILKGAKPGDLPVQQPNKYELIVNLKTARALGITVPTTLLGHRGRGDRIAAECGRHGLAKNRT